MRFHPQLNLLGMDAGYLMSLGKEILIALIGRKTKIMSRCKILAAFFIWINLL